MYLYILSWPFNISFSNFFFFRLNHPLYML
uniref:Uncharacterized protein n=1 Tax=Arundo donax TaxID=35708 RepID=A0A0A8XQC7_ARUDO